jgi:HEAT repeat protein
MVPRKDTAILIPPDAKAAVPRLIRTLTDPKPDDRFVQALGGIGPDAKAAIPLLIPILDPKNDELLRESAIAALGEIGPDSRVAGVGG